LEVLTRGVELFLLLSVRRGQSACAWRTLREVRVQPSSSWCSSCSCFVSVRSNFVFGFCCSQFADGPGFSSGRSGTRADGPRGLRGRSVFRGASLVVLLAFTDCPWHLVGLSAWPLRTVHGTWPDCPRGQCGPSAPPGRTVRQSLAALFLGSIPPFLLSCFYVCF
jgi:hypothetical protein